MTYPIIPPKQIPCGGYQDFVILDGDGKLKKVRIEAGSSAQGTVQGKQPTSTGGSASQGEPVVVHSRSTTSLLVADTHDIGNIFNPSYDAEVLLMSNIASWRNGFRRRVPIWRITVADDGQITANLPADVRNTSGELLFVPDPGDE